MIYRQILDGMQAPDRRKKCVGLFLVLAIVVLCVYGIGVLATVILAAGGVVVGVPIAILGTWAEESRAYYDEARVFYEEEKHERSQRISTTPG